MYFYEIQILRKQIKQKEPHKDYKQLIWGVDLCWLCALVCGLDSWDFGRASKNQSDS